MSLNPNPDAPFAISCDMCHGAGYILGVQCRKCDGNGAIIITPIQPLTKSQIVVREMAWILVGGAAAGFVILALLHWFHLL